MCLFWGEQVKCQESMVVNEHRCGIGYGSETAGPGWRLAVESEMWGAVDEGRDAVVEVCEATNVDCGAVEEGLDAVDEGHNIIEG